MACRVTIALLLGLAACSRLELRPDAVAEKREVWWNFYRRGLEVARAGKWQAAAAHYEAALGERPGALWGRPGEAWRAKTYGLHTIDNYFPYRELGVSLFYLGRLDAAEARLERSLASLPSSRAKHYLNEVRRARLRAAAGTAPMGTVAIRVEAPEKVWYSNSPSLSVRGEVTSPGFVSQVTINGQPVFVELASPRVGLDRTVALADGHGTVEIQAADLAGASAAWRREVVVDRRGPIVSIGRDPAGGRGAVRVRVHDNEALAAVTVNGTPAEVAPGAVRVEVPVNLVAGAALAVTATDRAGNRTAFEAAADELLTTVRDAWRQRPLLRLAAAGRFGAVAAVPSTPDTKPPDVWLHPDPGERRRVTTDAYLVDAEVRDSGLAEVVVSINGKGEPVPLPDENSVAERLTVKVQLGIGANTIQLEARDRAGNKTVRSFVVERAEDLVWREDLRLTAQVLPPTGVESSPLRGQDLHRLVIDEFVHRDPRRLRIVERDPAVMQRALLELKLMASDLVECRRAMDLGRIKPADWLIAGECTAWPGQHDCELVLEVVDVQDESLECLLREDIHFARHEVGYVKDQVNGLVTKLLQQLPATSGRVERVQGANVVLDLGKQQGLRPGLRVVFVSQAEVDAGGPVEIDGTRVEGRVSDVRENGCRAGITPKAGAAKLAAGDYAIVR